MRKRVLGFGAVAGVALATMVGMPANAISSTSADLSVFHGIPGLPVDVYVNGALTLDDFQPGTLAGPLDLPAGSYDIDIRGASDPDTAAPLLEATVQLAANTSYTAVAHLDADDNPTITAFTNNIAATAAGQGRLTVRHVAAAPAVDVLAGGSVVVPGLTNPNEATLDLPAGTISASVALAGTTTPVIGPADVQISDGVLTVVYAYGSAADGTLALAEQRITVGHTSPSGVISGTAGYYAEQQSAQQAWTLGGVLAAAAGLAALVIVLRRRATQRGDI